MRDGRVGVWYCGSICAKVMLLKVLGSVCCAQSGWEGNGGEGSVGSRDGGRSVRRWMLVEGRGRESDGEGTVGR